MGGRRGLPHPEAASCRSAASCAVNDGDQRVTRFLGAQAHDRTGTVERAGDLDRDGAPDVLVGAPFAARDGRADAGVVHLLAP